MTIVLFVGTKTQAAFHTAARAVAHVAQCVEFFRGSRVEDYQPVCQLLSKLASPALLTPAKQSGPKAKQSGPPAKQSGSKAKQSGPPAAVQDSSVSRAEPNAAAVDEEVFVGGSGDVLQEVQEFVAPSLSEQALRLLQALVAGHDQVALLCSSSSLLVPVGCICVCVHHKLPFGVHLWVRSSHASLCLVMLDNCTTSHVLLSSTPCTLCTWTFGYVTY